MSRLKEEGVGKLRGVSVAVQTETDTYSRINQVSTDARGRNRQRADDDSEKKERIPERADQRTESDPVKRKRNQKRAHQRTDRNQEKKKRQDSSADYKYASLFTKTSNLSIEKINYKLMKNNKFHD